MRLDIAGGLRLVPEERILYLWITSFGAQNQANSYLINPFTDEETGV